VPAVVIGPTVPDTAMSPVYEKYGTKPPAVSVSGVAADPNAPPSLRRAASLTGEAAEGMAPPKITRSVTSYIRELSGDISASISAGPSGASPAVRLPSGGVPRAPGMARQQSERSQLLTDLGVAATGSDFIDSCAVPSEMGVATASANPPLVAAREHSLPNLGRSVSSFVRDFIDTSAELEAPPQEAVPPPLAASMSSGSISDFLK